MSSQASVLPFSRGLRWKATNLFGARVVVVASASMRSMGFPARKMGVAQASNGWFTNVYFMENPKIRKSKMDDDEGCPHFRRPSHVQLAFLFGTATGWDKVDPVPTIQ